MHTKHRFFQALATVWFKWKSKTIWKSNQNQWVSNDLNQNHLEKKEFKSKSKHNCIMFQHSASQLLVSHQLVYLDICFKHQTVFQNICVTVATYSFNRTANAEQSFDWRMSNMRFKWFVIAIVNEKSKLSYAVQCNYGSLNNCNYYLLHWRQLRQLIHVFTIISNNLVNFIVTRTMKQAPLKLWPHGALDY